MTAAPERKRKPGAPVPGSLALLTAGDLAALFQVSVQTIRRLAARGELPAPLRVGRRVRWSARTLEEWMARGKR
jgi:excisionase family DNA binding protein